MQMQPKDQKQQRGIAMMVVLFALLLLSVVGLGMMYSTNMETSINGNYRDKQNAFYAALAGLQEARERIRTSGNTYAITPPTSLPSTAGANVIYIVSNAASVVPYLYSANKFFDTELCQEKTNIFTGTATVGVPCSSAYSTATWYQIVDDSTGTANAAWNLTYPLDWKWTRITLKANNMTQYPVNGTSTDASQACWNGTYQMSTPTGYSTGCQPNGGVTAIFVTNSGTGYSSTAPTVIICGTDTAGTNGCPSTSSASYVPGSGATATATMAQGTTGYVSSIAVTNGGSGYSTAPTVTITGGDGVATGTAILSATGTTVTNPGSVATITLTTGGSGYSSAPTVTIGGDGSGATATATLATSGGTTTSNTSIGSVTLTNTGKGYTSAPTVTLGGGGSGATVTASLNTSSGGEIVSVTLPSLAGDGTDPCFANSGEVTFNWSGPGSGVALTANLESTRSCIRSFTNMPVSNCNNGLDSSNGYNPQYQKSGVAYANLPNFSGTLSVSTSNPYKAPTGVTVQKPGYNTGQINNATTYTGKFELYNNGSTTTAWTSHSNKEDCNNLDFTSNTGYRLSSITVTSGGSGYTSSSALTISGGAGSTYPTPTVTVGYPISATVSAGGSGYSSPTISFSGGQPAGCGGLCTTATGTLALGSTTTYPVAYVTLTNAGTGYTTAPVSFSGGGTGSGAQATTTLNTTSSTTYSVASVSVNCSSTSTTSCIGYTTATVSFSGTGSGAAATANISQKNSGVYYVDTISLNGTAPMGSGYTSNPQVMLTGGTGSGATASSQISGGTKFGQVYVLTSLAQTSTGARSMLQMEVASPILGYSPGGALTLDGPAPIINQLPNSGNFVVDGRDQNICGETQDPPHPAVDGYDNPSSPTSPSAVTTILNAIPSGRTADYIGSGTAPSVQNGYAALGPTMNTPDGLYQLINNITTTATSLVGKNVGVAGGVTGYIAPSTANVTCNSNCGTITSGGTNIFSLGSCSSSPATPAHCNTVIDVVKGNLTLQGSGTGYGILLVEGTLDMGGNFAWYGPIFVVGDGKFNYGGGGNAVLQGNLLVANIWSSDNATYPMPSSAVYGANNMGSPTIHWNGGGGNGIKFDHCWSTDLMNNVGGTYTSPIPFKVLSFRILPY